MYKGLMRLDDAELKWLGGTDMMGGRISTIEVQKGCPWNCIICGVCAPKKTKNMPWSDYMIISDSISDVYYKKGIDVLAETKIDPFESSDPLFYHSKDGKDEKTIYHIVEDISGKHVRNVGFTTAGWIPGNTYMQRAMEEIVNNYPSEGEPRALITYSIKATTKPMLQEYNRFIEENNGKSLDLDTLNSKFIHNSRYLARIVENVKTLLPIASRNQIVYGLQAMDPRDIGKLHGEYERYKDILGIGFIKKVTEHIVKHLGEEGISNYPIQGMKSRYFAGIGRVLELGDIEESQHLIKNNQAVNYQSEVDENMYFVKIDADGQLNIYYGSMAALSSIKVPKEHFQIMARQQVLKEKREEYTMLANLQGRNLLG